MANQNQGDRGMRHWDEQRDRDADASGQGQSGYAAGRREERPAERGMGRNQEMGRMDDRDRGGAVHSDDRFYGRGGGSNASQHDRGDAPRGYGDDGDRPRFVQHPGYQGGSAFGRVDTGYDRGQRGQQQYGNYDHRMNQHGGYGPSNQGNYGQSGNQDSFGEGQFNQRGTQQGGQPRGMQQGSGGNFDAQPSRGHRGKGPQNYMRSDERIREHVSEMLMEHDHIDASNLHVEVENGEVTLTGTVEDRHQRRLIEDLVEEISGVKEIHMSIKLHGDRSNGGGHKSATSSTTPTLENNGAATANDSRKARA